MLGASYDVHGQDTRQDGHVGPTLGMLGTSHDVHGQDTRQDRDVHWVCLEHLMMSMAKIPGRTEMCIGYAWNIS